MKPQDKIKIAYKIANRIVTHPVYPQVDDYVQDMQENILKWKKGEEYPVSTMYYSVGKTKEKYARRKNCIGQDVSLDSLAMNQKLRQNINLEGKVIIKDFMSRLKPFEKHYFQWLLEGYQMTEIAEGYGISRQACYVAIDKIIKKYNEMM